MQAPTQMISVQIILVDSARQPGIAPPPYTKQVLVWSNSQRRRVAPLPPFLYRGDFFDESDAGIKPVLLYWKYKPQAGKVTRRT